MFLQTAVGAAASDHYCPVFWMFFLFSCVGTNVCIFFFKHRCFCLFAYNLNKTILQLFAVLHTELVLKPVLNSFLLSLAQERCHPFHTILHYFFSSVKLLVCFSVNLTVVAHRGTDLKFGVLCDCYTLV